MERPRRAVKTPASNPPSWDELPDRRVQQCLDGHDLFHDPLVQVHVPFDAQ
jgi:hypothetical protein